MTLSLFARDVSVVVLGSGSGGNCTYVGDGHAGVLIDCGLSTKQILLRLEAVGLGSASIDGVLVTHEHSDHIGAARILSDRLHRERGKRVPFFMTRGTFLGAHPRVLPERVETVVAGKPFRVRHVLVDPFPIPHDVADPVAYRVELGGVAVAVLTDLGRPTNLIRRKLRDLDVAVIESNHDVDMLLEGPYPWHLKQRIRSSHGHLSNEQCAELLQATYGPRLQAVVLAHLSEDNNCSERAVHVARGVVRDRRVRVEVAPQAHALTPIRVRARTW